MLLPEFDEAKTAIRGVISAVIVRFITTVLLRPHTCVSLLLVVEAGLIKINKNKRITEFLSKYRDENGNIDYGRLNG